MIHAKELTVASFGEGWGFGEGVMKEGKFLL